MFQQNLPETLFCWQGHEKVQKALEKALERDWEQTQHMATVRTVAGTARHHLKTTHACEVSGRRPHPVLSKGVTFAYFWLVRIKSSIFIRSTLCFNLLCSTTLSHRHVASEDSRRQESKPDEEQFQLLFLLLPCAVSVPSAFPAPFQCLFQCLFTVCVRLPVILPCDSLFC